MIKPSDQMTTLSRKKNKNKKLLKRVESKSKQTNNSWGIRSSQCASDTLWSLEKLKKKHVVCERGELELSV